MRREVSARESSAHHEADEELGQAQSAAAAIAFSGLLGVGYSALQMFGLASREGFIGTNALVIISASCLAVAGVMSWKARRLRT